MDNHNFYEQQDPEQGRNDGPRGQQGPYGQNPYDQPGYGQDPYGQQNPYGQGPYGQNPYGQNPYGQGPQQPTGPNGMAIASFVLGLLSLCTCWCIYSAIPMGAAGLVLAILSRMNQKMHGLAIAGLILSILSMVLAVGYIIFAFQVFQTAEFQEIFREIYGTEFYR